MTVRRQPTQEDQQRMLDAERMRLRKIGLRAIVGFVVVLAVAIIALAGGGNDHKKTLLVFSRDADKVDIDKGQFVRVHGSMERVVDDDRYKNANALVADKVRISKASDSAKGLTPVDSLRRDNVTLEQPLVVVGKVESVDHNTDVFSISQPKQP